MRSAVEAWSEGHDPGAAHGRSRYKPMCPCCAPELASAQTGRPQRRVPTRPTLAWRVRFAEKQAQDASLLDNEFDG